MCLTFLKVKVSNSHRSQGSKSEFYILTSEQAGVYSFIDIQRNHINASLKHKLRQKPLFMCQVLPALVCNSEN